MPVSLSRIIHHSHSFTRPEIYHHIYFITLLLLTKHVAVKLRGCWRRKSAALEVDGVPHALHSIALMNRLTLNSKEKCLDLNNIVHCLTGRGILQNAECQMLHFHHL